MMPYMQASQLFGLGTGLEGLGASSLDFAGNAAQMQLAAQAQQQAVNNARASAGKGGGLLGGIANAGLNYAFSGGNPFAAASGAIGGGSAIPSIGAGSNLLGTSFGLGGVSYF